MAEVFVIGTAATRLLAPHGTAAELAYRVASEAIADAGVQVADIPAVFVGSGGSGPHPDAAAVAVRLGLRRLGFTDDVEGGSTGRIEHVSASAGDALHRGRQAIEMDLYELVLCVGAERRGGDWPPEPLLRSRAESARRYMSVSGATADHLARTSVKNLRHGALDRGERQAGKVTPEDVLESKLLEWPLTRLMVAPSGAGAAAVVLASDAARRRLARAAPRVLASLLVAREDERDVARRAARLAYETSGVGPEDLDCAELDDVTAAAELAAYEDLQLAPEGQGPELIDSGFTALGGVLPVNTSGGLLSHGELPGVSGLAQVCQIARQLRGEAGALQVPGARVGLAQSGGRAQDNGGLVALTILAAEL